MKRVYNVRIDRVTQGPDGHEKPADRLSINSEDFLWIYVEAKLPSGSPPLGQYYKVGVDNRVPIKPPTLVNGQYRFSVIHYGLQEKSKYEFRFADDLKNPNYEDRWEIVTIARQKSRH